MGESLRPVYFEEEELLQHRGEMDMREGISEMFKELQNEGIVPLGGRAHPEVYQRTMELNNYANSLAENEQ